MPAPTVPLDRLSSLLERFRVRATLHHQGPLCGRVVFAAEPGRALLHVLRRGTVRIEHPAGHGVPRRVEVREPSVLLYPRGLRHVFATPPRDGSDFRCATLHFDGGDRHPLVAALPALVLVPLAAVPELSPALQLLFSETDRPRCASRPLADRLFEVVLLQLLRWLLDHPAAVGHHQGVLLGLSDPRLAAALSAVHDDPAAPWTVPRLARTAGLSRSAFIAVFKSALGITPAAYVADWRLTLAASRLQAGEPQKVVAASLGFGSPSSFSRAFRQRFGVSPREWRHDGTTAPSPRASG